MTEYDPFARGPHPVGVRTIDVPDAARDRVVPVEVWYPATDGYAGQDLDDATRDAFELMPGLPASRQDAVRDAEPAAGPFPAVVFSHGFAGHRRQTTHLCTHLASHGYAVAAPDHVERSLDGLLGTAAQGVTPSTDPEVLSAALESGVRLGLEGGAKPNRDGRPEVGDPHVLHADQRFTFTIQPRVSTSADYQVRLFARREGASDGVVLACPRWTLHGEHGVQRCAFDEASALGLGPGTWEVFAVFGAEERLPNTIAGALDSSGALRTSGAGWRLAEGPLRIEYRRP